MDAKGNVVFTKKDVRFVGISFVTWHQSSGNRAGQRGQLVLPCREGRGVHPSMSWCSASSLWCSGLQLLSTLTVRIESFN